MNNRHLQRVIDGCGLLAHVDVARVYSLSIAYVYSRRQACLRDFKDIATYFS